MHRRRCRSAILALGVLASLLVPTTVAAPPAAAAPSGARNVIVQLFEWNWPSVASECTNVLGPKGYGYVQVSPPQEHVRGNQWWLAYQPVSYRIESRKGTRAQFQSMVNTCHAAGVKVIVDAVINHMSGQDTPGTGWAGSSYSHYDYPGVYQTQDFHHCGRNGGDDIVNYNDRYEVQNCELVNLSDLKTESDYVRSKIAAYLNDLLALGVDGFRLDASKHMPAADIAAIKGKLSRSAYVVQEVIYGAGEPIGPGEYTGNGDVHEFRYGKDLARMFNSERLAYLRNFGEAWGYLPSGSAEVFVDNHDTQRDGNVLTYRNGAAYALANAFMLAWPYGAPTVMSSYTFSSRDQGPPSDANNKTLNTTCYSGWECEHRWRVVANMVGFHNATQGAAVANWYDNGYQHIAFSRAGKGYLTINDEGSAITGRSYYAGLPAGRYCDVIHGDYANGSCSGPVITVDANGWFAANIPAHDAVAIHVGARLS
ncbi:alpha-amylase [Micromonospora purpureochromogenes]|uniref:Alpha-amylase n=1 Tax=Micromonospora purpureochromogenes TaxID=47872 RepID=A0ABX2RHF1_9ACTN|nr:alpha-amylase family protein [Micromonospora purpureochromogenes]NYF54549.1 alpha-amylase [Micromonospora purpureochromogenes]